jgi:hypothetical protein
MLLVVECKHSRGLNDRLVCHDKQMDGGIMNPHTCQLVHILYSETIEAISFMSYDISPHIYKLESFQY